jgi:hypothetical protein
MRLSVIKGMIRRRILVNLRVDARVMQTQLPSRFRPKLQAGHAIAGICLIRLDAVRPSFVPQLLGLSSENAAHRIAVRWTVDGGEKEGVFIPRRDTGSVVNHLAGGRLFPGEHHRARFTVREGSASIDLSMQSEDRTVSVRVRETLGGTLPRSSCFASLTEASPFFEPGSLGYSVTSDASRLDGIELRTHGWSIEPLQVEEVHSSYFSDEARFPRGSVVFDCALAMRNLAHEWHSAEDLYV